MDRKVGLESRRHICRQVGGVSRMIDAIPIESSNDGSVDDCLLVVDFAVLLDLFFLPQDSFLCI